MTALDDFREWDPTWSEKPLYQVSEAAIRELERMLRLAINEDTRYVNHDNGMTDDEVLANLRARVEAET